MAPPNPISALSRFSPLGSASGALETSQLEQEGESRRRKLLPPSLAEEPLVSLELPGALPCHLSSAAEPFLGGT